jgi:hypothetical protein
MLAGDGRGLKFSLACFTISGDLSRKYQRYKVLLSWIT